MIHQSTNNVNGENKCLSRDKRPFFSGNFKMSALYTLLLIHPHYHLIMKAIIYLPGYRSASKNANFGLYYSHNRKPFKNSPALTSFVKCATLQKAMTEIEHTRTILQYADVLQLAAAYCVTEGGKEKTANALPETNPKNFGVIDAEKKLGETLMNLLASSLAPTLKYFPPIAEYLAPNKTFLQIEEIYALGLFTQSVAELQRWAELSIAKTKTENAATTYIKNFPDLTETAHIVFSLLDKDGRLQAIPSLKAIEREITAAESDLQAALRRYFTDDTYSQVLQSSVPTIRDGRQVIAVKANFKGRIAGIIHEYSQTGQTFYLEPADVVSKNNDILEARSRYDAELKRILTETSAHIFARRAEIASALELFSSFDFLFAGAKLAHENKWSYPESAWTQEGNYQTRQDASYMEGLQSESIYLFALKKACHPLLKMPVPIDIVLPPQTKVLIITGPNAGGKTVTLKTICLFALLNQTGLPVPCEAESRLPYFDYIACDIGDDQSIDLSLSTFSSHMKNVAAILEKASAKSLIALDELGSGTEVQEGSAIAMAILDELLKRQSYVFVTSHHASLKNYGYTKPNCENASVEFDEKNLRPNYRIIMGVPGESHAFDIARKSGLSESIVESAKAFLGENRTDVSVLIKDLISKNKQADAFIEAAKEKEKYSNEKIRKVDLKELKLKQKELVLREQGYKRLENFFLEKRKELENLIRKIREGELDKEKISDAKNWLENFERDLQKEKAEMAEEKTELSSGLASVPTADVLFKEGDSVFSLDYSRNGRVLRAEKNNKYLVEVGSLKLTLSGEQLRPIKVETPKPSFGVELTKTEKPVLELRLLGMREAEAQKALINQLDLAAVSGLKEFSVVHGKGDGILQQMVHRVLAKTNFVSEYRFARPEEGGTGKTVVTLK